MLYGREAKSQAEHLRAQVGAVRNIAAEPEGRARVAQAPGALYALACAPAPLPTRSPARCGAAHAQDSPRELSFACWWRLGCPRDHRVTTA